MKFFKNITALLLLAIYLFAATATMELLKLPLLVKHYYQHKAENKNTGVISFLKMHYNAKAGTNKNSKDDDRLPFKSVHHAAAVFFISLTPPLVIEVFAKREIKNKTAFRIPDHLQLPSKYLVAIWQPPRNC